MLKSLGTCAEGLNLNKIGISQNDGWGRANQKGGSMIQVPNKKQFAALAGTAQSMSPSPSCACSCKCGLPSSCACAQCGGACGKCKCGIVPDDLVVIQVR